MSHVKVVRAEDVKTARQKAREDFERRLNGAFPDPDEKKRRAAAAMLDVWWEGTDPWEGDDE